MHQYYCEECKYQRPGLLDNPAVGSTICPECGGKYNSFEVTEESILVDIYRTSISYYSFYYSKEMYNEKIKELFERWKQIEASSEFDFRNRVNDAKKN